MNMSFSTCVYMYIYICVNVSFPGAGTICVCRVLFLNFVLFRQLAIIRSTI